MKTFATTLSSLFVCGLVSAIGLSPAGYAVFMIT